MADLITQRYRALVLTAAYAGCQRENRGPAPAQPDVDARILRVLEQTVEFRNGDWITADQD